MKEAGFAYLAFGVEGGNDKILKKINKGETMDDFNDSISLALRYPVFDVRFYNLIPFPQSELFDWVNKNDYFIISPADYLNSSSHWGNTPVLQHRT